MGYDIKEECKKARELIYESVRKELLGPGSEDIGSSIEHEIITDEPIARYSTGILFPQKCENVQDDNSSIDMENSTRVDDEELKNKEETKNISHKGNNYNNSLDSIEDQIDEKIAMANELKPSSMGITFFARGNVDKLCIRLKAAKYRKSTLKDCCIKYEGEDFFLSNELEDYLYRDGEFLKLKANLTSQIVKKFKDEDRYKEDEGYRNIISILYVLARQCKDEVNKRHAYVREPLNFPEVIEIKLDNDYVMYPFKCIGGTKENVKVKADLEICVVRRKYGQDINSYTVVLVNKEEVDTYGRDLKSIFQPEIRIKTEDNKGMFFIEDSSKKLVKNNLKLDDEEEALELLYRNKKNYATGHGVSMSQQVNANGEGEISTTFLPKYEVPSMSFEIEELSKEKSNEILSMKNLSDISDLSKEHKIENLRELVSLYDKWIKGLKDEISELEDIFKNAAEKHIKECELSLNRMKRGIDLIEKDEEVYVAFSLMNRALLMQRVHSTVKERYSDADIALKEELPQRLKEKLKEEFPKFDYKSIEVEKAKWRPFQLGFILMTIESIIDPSCEDRDIVDLIWVPTGGGKTEAYLGLSAFTIFLRRLKNPKNGGGTTILMRYTLRLLAAQQFIRASIMICACELIRREGKYNLGKEKITIGLWIGSNQTPNKREQAKKYWDELKKKSNSKFDLDYRKDTSNKFQLLKCPWCGTKLEKDYVFDEEEKNERKRNKEIELGTWGYEFTGKTSKIFCPEEECPFGNELPVQVVDEAIYENPPTLLFGTVDKFAMTTWEANASKLFALDEGNENPSPELIIQDELHLISGPLGTIVGLYETAIDAMCNEKRIKPKVIASTATIRRAKDQCNQLYVRDVKQFPPSGLLAEDSFFVKENKHAPGRIYVGLLPTGKTLTTTQVRLMSALTNRVKMLDIPEEVKSEYWTLVCYFNTLKELGMTNSLIQADIQENINIVSNRLLKRKYARNLYNTTELTSRKTANEINKTLDNLEINYSSENIANKKYAIDVLLASNMISVGVDVSRLNLMMVLEQPKLTAEYIQATSRVGRKNPGLVFTLYSPSRSRDKSHYEMFHDYHQSFYKHVEPTSITCFSEPAIDRMLHSVFIAMIRHILGLASEDSAECFDTTAYDIDKIKNIIVDRASNLLDRTDVSKEVKSSEIDYVEKRLEEIIGRWEDKIENLGNDKYLKYHTTKKEGNVENLIKPFGKKEENGEFETLQSMRNVDTQGRVDLIVFGGDEDE
ncbi:helicase [Clostridium sporogenes]|uniref:helicase-related protein n=1 Tax=Clostridium sporogenes TaxID=1509 RepID=UPI0013D26C9B|nr:helicase-related protein [Clostridium sporogenes]NFM16728.1 helicase [Clostridium sporogenes]